MFKADPPKKYTPEEYLKLKGETFYVIQANYNFGGGYITSDNHFIPVEEVPHLKNILGIEISVIDDAPFQKMAAAIYDDVFEYEFKEWVRRKKLEDPEEKSDISLWCKCEDREMYAGTCSICGKPLERIGG